MPSNRQRFLSVVASAAITLGGAWLASQFSASINTRVATAAPLVDVSDGPSLSVEITGLRNASGQVIVLVFDEEGAFADFDYRKAVGYDEIDAVRGGVKAAFSDLETGPYAVMVFHDENGDRDLNLEGELPLEGFAISGAADAYDAPSFRQAAVASGAVRLKLHYFE